MCGVEYVYACFIYLLVYVCLGVRAHVCERAGQRPKRSNHCMLFPGPRKGTVGRRGMGPQVL